MKIHVIFASETGRAKETAEDVHRELYCKGYDAHPARDVATLSLADFLAIKNAGEPLIFLTSTAGQGETPTSFRPLWNDLRQARLPGNFLKGLDFTVFGLGDSGYVQFNYAARRMNMRLEALGGKAFHRMGLGDDQHDFGQNQEFDPWLEELFESLQKLIGPPPFPAREPPLTAFKIELANDPTTETSKLKLSINDTDQEPSLFQLLLERYHDYFKKPIDQKPREPSLSGGHTPHLRGGTAFVRSCGRMTKDDHFQDVRRVCLDTAVDYEAGSVAVFYPRTARETVLDFLKDIGISEQLAQTQVYVTLLEGFEHLENPFPRYAVTIEDLFSCYVDISAVPGRVFFHALSKFCTGFQEEGQLQKDKLAEFAGRSPEDKNALLEYCGREGRNTKEIMWDFFVARPPLDVLLTFIPPMRPRYYSIASAPKALFPLAIKCWNDPALAQHIRITREKGMDLCIALVEWKTKLNRVVKGSMSQNVETLQPGQVIPMDVVPGLLINIPLTTPLIMICPGTGLSPCRAIIQERKMVGKKGMKDLLFLGFRHPEKDFLFGDEWDEYSDVVDVYETFSRCIDNPKYNEDPYVQHVLKREAKTVVAALDAGARVLVCGRSNPMPKQVMDAFVHCLMKEGGMEEEEARIRLDGMTARGEYICDTWG